MNATRKLWRIKTPNFFIYLSLKQEISFWVIPLKYHLCQTVDVPYIFNQRIKAKAWDALNKYKLPTNCSLLCKLFLLPSRMRFLSFFQSFLYFSALLSPDSHLLCSLQSSALLLHANHFYDLRDDWEWGKEGERREKGWQRGGGVEIMVGRQATNGPGA